MERNVKLADVLYNMHDKSGATDDYRKGVLVGVVSALVATGLDFNQAITQVAFHMPDVGSRLYSGTVPDSWRESLLTRMLALGKRYIYPI
jgi:hypothetical protein